MIDIQTSQPPYNIAINQVGIKSLKHPVLLEINSNISQATIATFDMMVYLEANRRGTHMSRFIEILNQKTWTMSINSMQELLAITANKLEAKDVFIKSQFEFFINKTAPVSKAAGLINYQASFAGNFQKNSCTITVVVPVTTLCPCSKAISEYGAHNQRSFITITITTTSSSISLEYIIRLAEQEASCELYSILKRPDEKYVTEYAYNNPKFAEDIVRNIAKQLAQNQDIKYYKVETENFESIHNHSAYAMIEQKIE